MYQLFLGSSTAGFAPHILLRELGVEFELKLLDLEAGEHKRPEYLAVNPLGRVPALVTDRETFSESSAICLWLADKHSAAGLAPGSDDPQRATYLQWMFFLSNTVQAALMPYFYPQRYIADEAQHNAVKQQAISGARGWFEHVDRHLATNGPWLLGEQLSAADFYLFMLVRWGRRFENPPSALPALRVFMHRLFERAAVQDALAAEGAERRY